MRKTALRIATLLSFLLLVSFAVIVFNQTAQLVELADRVNPSIGTAVFYSLIALYAFCIFVPVFLLFRLPKPLQPPPSDAHPEFPRHLQRLGKRLSRNPLLSDPTIESREEIDSALITLDSAADQRTKAAASQVFVTTAISQNGSLDALLVLAAQSKLILEIARVYYQRPTLRDLIFLYTNVGATAFIAGELEDLDLSEQVQPVLTSVLGSAAGAIPGLGAATNLFVNSVVTGTGNAFLTLRVGAITKQYCRAVVLPERRIIRRVAVIEAASMLGSIAKDGARRVGNAFASGSKNAFVSAYTEMREDLRYTGSEIKRKSSQVKARLRPRRDPADGLEGAEG
jgi:hypothetical protein